MKKTLISLFLFSLFAGILYILFLFIHASFLPNALGGNVFKYDDSYDYSLSRLNEADTTTRVDVLIIGSSHAYRGYDVRLFEQAGLKAFNLGTSAQTLFQTQYLVNKYIDKLKPKIIVFDIYPQMLNNDGLESTLELLSISKPDNALVKMALKSYDVKAYNSLLYYMIKNDARFFKSKLHDKASKENVYVKGGYVENNTTGDIFKHNKTTLIFAQKQRKCLEEIVNSFKKRNIKYYLFQSPVTESKYRSINNNEEIDAALKSFGEYYNFNAGRTLNDSCFMDDNHLNSRGVRIYDKFVLNKILRTN